MAPPISLRDASIQNDYPKAAENQGRSIGAQMIANVIGDNRDERLLTDTVERIKIFSYYDEADGFIENATAVVKTIWAGLVYILKRPIIFMGHCFGYELFLDRTLIDCYQSILKIDAEMALFQQLSYFLFEIQKIANTSDTDLLRQVILAPSLRSNPNLYDLRGFLKFLSKRLVSKYLSQRDFDYIVGKEVTFKKKEVCDYIDSLNSAMEGLITLEMSDLAADFSIREGLNDLKKDIFLRKYSRQEILEKRNTLCLPKVHLQYLQHYDIDQFINKCSEALTPLMPVLEELKSYAWIDRLIPSIRIQNDYIITFYIEAFMLSLCLDLIGQNNLPQEEQLSELDAIKKEYINDPKFDEKYQDFLNADGDQAKIVALIACVRKYLCP